MSNMPDTFTMMPILISYSCIIKSQLFTITNTINDQGYMATVRIKEKGYCEVSCLTVHQSAKSGIITICFPHIGQDIVLLGSIVFIGISHVLQFQLGIISIII